MEEHNKSWFLRELIRLNAFSTSASSLARLIDYTGKNQMYRLVKGVPCEGTAEEVWRRIREKYDLTDEELCEYANVIGTAKDIWKEVQAKAADICVDVRVLAEETLHALLLCNEEGMRRILNLWDWDRLLDYSRDHPMQYAQLIVIYFVEYNSIVHAYKGSIAEDGTALLMGLYRQMQQLQPENRMLKEMADAYLSEMGQMTGNGNLWTITLRPAILVQSFIDPNFRLDTISLLRLLPVPINSLWMEPGSLSNHSAMAFIFFEMEPDGATGGRYDCIEVDAEQKDTNLAIKRFFSLWMLKPGQGETCSQAYIQFRDDAGQKQIVRYQYEYDEKSQNLHLEPIGTENPKCITFPFPTDLHWLNDKHQIMKDERKWMAWYKDFISLNEDEIIIEMMKSDGVVLVDDYEILDVWVSRRFLMVTISNGVETSDFSVELEKHPGLQLVSPKMEVAVFFHEDDKQLYLEWISPHVCIPMKAFIKM